MTALKNAKQHLESGRLVTLRKRYKSYRLKNQLWRSDFDRPILHMLCSPAAGEQISTDDVGLLIAEYLSHICELKWDTIHSECDMNGKLPLLMLMENVANGRFIWNKDDRQPYNPLFRFLAESARYLTVEQLVDIVIQGSQMHNRLKQDYQYRYCVYIFIFTKHTGLINNNASYYHLFY
jgi:hypothetical protein